LLSVLGIAHDQHPDESLIPETQRNWGFCETSDAVQFAREQAMDREMSQTHEPLEEQWIGVSQAGAKRKRHVGPDATTSCSRTSNRPAKQNADPQIQLRGICPAVILH
jgi:hypothetical protein